MSNMILIGLTALGTLSLLPAACAQNHPVHPKGYVCYRAESPLVIDGRLDETSWQQVPWTEDFVDIEGDKKPIPQFRTHAKMLWDDEYFYIGAELEEPHVWGTLTEHDSVIFHDNDFEIFIDPDGDNHEYYEIEINALNTEWDLRLVKPYRDGGPALNSWEIPGLKTAVYVDGTLNNPTDTDRFWSIEFAFPWKVLAEFANRTTPPQDGDQWRINFSRVEWQHVIEDGQYRKVEGIREDNWVWSPQGVIDMHRPETWGYVQFSTGKPGNTEFQPDPAFPVRMLLQNIYYAQKKHRQEDGAWATAFAALGVEAADCAYLVGSPTIQIVEGGFVATADIRPPDGQVQRWHIRQDSRVWQD